MERRDIAIIGTGPGGVSAAITAKIRGKSLYLFGNKHLSEKMEKAAVILNYPGLPKVSGMALADGMRQQLKDLDIPILETQVTAVYAMGDFFAIHTPDDMVEASAVILAAGVVNGKPLPGEQERLGRGVSYCATCDGQFYRGKTVAVVGYSQHSCEEANFLSEVAGKVLYFPAVSHELALNPGIPVVNDKPAAIDSQGLIGKAVQTTLWTAFSSCGMLWPRTGWCRASPWKGTMWPSTIKWRPISPGSSPAGILPVPPTSISKPPARATLPPSAP